MRSDIRFLAKHLSLCLSGRDVYFDQQRWGFLRHLLWWHQRVSSGGNIPSKETERMTVLFLNFRRPWNIRMLVRSALRCECVERVIVCDNSGTLHPRGLFTDPRVDLRIFPENRGTIVRFEVAQSCSGRFFLAIDDDLLLTPEQIHALFLCLRTRPDVPHGVFGEDIVDGEERVYAITGREGSIDIINRAYAFTREHVAAFFQILQRLAMTRQEELKRLTSGDDIILSHSGAGKPLCHDVGPLLSCPTSSLKGIAVFRKEGFWADRRELLGKLALQSATIDRMLAGRTTSPVRGRERLFCE